MCTGLIVLGWDLVVSCCDYGNEHSGFINDGEFLLRRVFFHNLLT
jgi:hypothetical protein